VRDEELIEAAKGGDRAAFGSLVEAYQGRLFRSACCLARNATDAEDLAQEVFVRAWRSLGRFRGGCAFYTWLFAILLNVYRTWLRRQRRMQRGRVEAATTDVADPAALPNRRAAAGDELMRALRVMDHLPRRLREVMVLRHVEQMSYEAIARAVGCRTGTVRSRLHRARRLLTVRWQQEHGVGAESARHLARMENGA